MHFTTITKENNTFDIDAGYTKTIWAFPLQIAVQHILKGEGMPINLFGFDIQFFCFYFSINYWYE